MQSKVSLAKLRIGMVGLFVFFVVAWAALAINIHTYFETLESINYFKKQSEQTDHSDQSSSIQKKQYYYSQPDARIRRLEKKRKLLHRDLLHLSLWSYFLDIYFMQDGVQIKKFEINDNCNLFQLLGFSWMQFLHFQIFIWIKITEMIIPNMSHSSFLNFWFWKMFRPNWVKNLIGKTGNYLLTLE